MRRFLLAFFLIGFIALAGVISILYVMRDQLILREARLQAEKLEPLHVEIGSLRTHVFGPVTAELGDIEARREKGAAVKLRDVRIETPLGLIDLYRAFSAKKEIPLSISLRGLKVALPTTAPGSGPAHAPAPAAWPKSIPVPAASPVPVSVELTLQGGDISGPAALKDLHGKVHARLRETGVEASMAAGFSAGLGGAGALLPVAVEATVSAGRAAVKVERFSVRSAGLDATLTGELGLAPVKGKFQAGVEAADLAHVALRAEDRAAVGLTAQPSGSVSLAAGIDVDPAGAIAAAGELRLGELLLPLRVPEKTAFAAATTGDYHVDGPVSVKARIPFSVRGTWSFGAQPVAFAVRQGSFAFDLTQASVVSKGRLAKASGIPLRGDVSFSSGPSGVDVSSLSLQFHTLTLSGSGSLPAPLGSQVSAGFRVQVANLDGFPAMLPMLREAEGKGSEAQGSVQAEGSLRLLPGAPARSLVDLRSFAVKGLRLPLAYESESAVARGVLTGSASGAGRFDAGDLNVSRSSGAFDLTGLELAVPGKFTKKRGRKLVAAFDAQGSTTKLAIRKASVTLDGIAASLSGTASFDKQRNARLALATTAHAELAALREYLPKLPFQVSNGVFDAGIRVGGTWIPAGGIEKSPLAVTGKISGKASSIVMPEPPKSAVAPGKPVPPVGPLLPPWPAARDANLAFRFDLGEFRRGGLHAKNVALRGSLAQGVFRAGASVGNVLGGKAQLRDLAGSLLAPKLAVTGSAAVDGLDLASAAAFVDPSYGKIVKGALKAESRFSVPDVWSDKLLETATADGHAQVRNGYLSTATFDGLVNEKLKGVPGLGDKAKITTGGLAAEIKTAFQVAGGTARLRDFVATTPRNDEMRLAGTLNLAFDCDLTGEAHLANAPVAGPVREANSDASGRLVVPVRFHGNLKAPQADVATGAIETMLKKTAAHELEKKKNALVDDAKKKAQGALEDAAGGLLDQFKKRR